MLCAITETLALHGVTPVVFTGTAVPQRLSGCIGDQTAALVAEAAQDMPHPLGRPLREWNAGASDIGSGLIAGAAFVLRLPRDLTDGDLLQHASEQLHADRR